MIEDVDAGVDNMDDVVGGSVGVAGDRKEVGIGGGRFGVGSV